ncbi:MAG: rubrerythrin family protein [Acidobacteriia bacterium]|nr:rubrerythrin family protein [Terriglobia bacterium]
MTKFGKITALASILLIAGLLVAAGGDPLAAAAKSNVSRTLQNLQSAYDSESNAHNRYVVFAQKAGEEGYGEVASLFRALARSEEIHMRNHAAAIRKMGAEPEATIVKFLAQSTQKNLESSAYKFERYESDRIYPRFIIQARAEGNGDAVRTFEYARAVAGQHFKLLTEALKKLENMHGNSRAYYVCTTCGATSEQPVQEMCPICRSPADAYEKVN